jgi:hypothetical protein
MSEPFSPELKACIRRVLVHELLERNPALERAVIAEHAHEAEQVFVTFAVRHRGASEMWLPGAEFTNDSVMALAEICDQMLPASEFAWPVPRQTVSLVGHAKEHHNMNPKTVAAARDIPNSAVADDPNVVALQRRHRDLEARHATAAEKAQHIRELLSRLPEQVEAVERELRQAEEERPGRIAAALLGEGDIAADDALLEKASQLRLGIERLRLAKPVLEQRLQVVELPVRRLGSAIGDLEVEISEARLAAKIAIVEGRN